MNSVYPLPGTWRRLRIYFALALGAGLAWAGGADAKSTPPTSSDSVLYEFQGYPDGFGPLDNLLRDGVNDLYGTTYQGGLNGNGILFQLVPPENNQGWEELVLYNFCSLSNCADGSNPEGGVLMDGGGTIYGTTFGGGSTSHGTVYYAYFSNHQWNLVTLHSFLGKGVGDGEEPETGMTWAPNGTLYGTTDWGGSKGDGTVYRLIPSGNGVWQYDVIYSFDFTHGMQPLTAVALDSKGNLYGTAVQGGTGCKKGACGVAYELSADTAGGFAQTVLWNFAGGKDGSAPQGNLVIGSDGSVYGTTRAGGNTKCYGKYGCGVIFKLQLTTVKKKTAWTETILYTFTGAGDGGNSYGGLTMYNGNLYGTTTWGGAKGWGSVFELNLTGTKPFFTTLYSFAGGSDAAVPKGAVMFDPSGHLYGTSQIGGNPGNGTVFEITP